MFGVDSSELAVVAILALIFIGPKDLPKVMRTVGYWVGRVRGMARHFTAGLENMVREAELEEMERPGHCCEIGKACTPSEEERRHDQERKEGLLLLGVEARRDKPPELRRDHREGQHDGREQSDFHLREEGLEYVRVDELALASAQQRLDQHGEYVLGEIEAHEEAGDEGCQRPQKPAPKFDQMLEKRLLAIVDVFHGSGRFSGGSSSSA